MGWCLLVRTFASGSTITRRRPKQRRRQQQLVVKKWLVRKVEKKLSFWLRSGIDAQTIIWDRLRMFMLWSVGFYIFKICSCLFGFGAVGFKQNQAWRIALLVIPWKCLTHQSLVNHPPLRQSWNMTVKCLIAVRQRFWLLNLCFSPQPCQLQLRAPFKHWRGGERCFSIAAGFNACSSIKQYILVHQRNLLWLRYRSFHGHKGPNAFSSWRASAQVEGTGVDSCLTIFLCWNPRFYVFTKLRSEFF